MGRPSKASAIRIEALLSALRAGNTREAAAAHAEIDRTTLFRWIASEPRLRGRVEKAEADAEVRFAAQIALAAGEDWRSAAWWLERRRSATYGRARAIVPAAVADPALAVLATHELDGLSSAEQASRALAWAKQLQAEARDEAALAAPDPARAAP